MTTHFFFFIEEKVTPSLNTFMRQHWRDQRKQTWIWLEYLTVFAREWDQDSIYKKVKITRRSTKLLDVDNLAGGCKCLIDALRKHGLIADDDPASVEITFAQEKVVKEFQGMRIEFAG